MTERRDRRSEGEALRSAACRDQLLAELREAVRALGGLDAFALETQGLDQLATALAEGTVRVWFAPTDEPLEACTMCGLSPASARLFGAVALLGLAEALEATAADWFVAHGGEDPS